MNDTSIVQLQKGEYPEGVKSSDEEKMQYGVWKMGTQLCVIKVCLSAKMKIG